MGSKVYWASLEAPCGAWTPRLAPLTRTNHPLRASAVRRARRLTPRGGVLSLSCCHLGVYLSHGLRPRCHNSLHAFPPV